MLEKTYSMSWPQLVDLLHYEKEKQMFSNELYGFVLRKCDLKDAK